MARKTVVGLYDELSEARKAVEELVDNGFKRDNVSLIAGDPEGRYGAELKEKAPEDHEVASGASSGAVVGGILGGLGGLVLGMGALVIPGVGPIIAAGPVVATLVGAAGGAVAGGIVGALIGWGIPEEEAKYYAEGVRRGGILVGVNAPEDRVDDVTRIMNKHNPVDIERRADLWREEGWEEHVIEAEPYTTKQATAERERYRARELETDEAEIPIMEEELKVGKREVERGTTRVRAYVVETPVEEKVTVREEKVGVERRPTDRPADPADLDAFEDTTLEVTERAEEVVAGKEARVVEDVVVTKGTEEHTETVRDTVRRTEVEVEGYDAYRDDFRSHYETTYANTGQAYDYYEPAYRYGRTLATDERYRGRTWSEIEPQVRSSWEAENKGTWDKFKDAVRHSWNRFSRGEADRDYREHYTTHYADTNKPYDYYEPGYQYGYALTMDERYQDRKWPEVEAEARRGWEKKHKDKGTWEEFKDSVRHGWHKFKNRTPA